MDAKPTQGGATCNTITATAQNTAYMPRPVVPPIITQHTDAYTQAERQRAKTALVRVSKRRWGAIDETDDNAKRWGIATSQCTHLATQTLAGDASH